MSKLAEFIGAIARPFSIICTSAAAAYATAVAVHNVTGGFEGAALIGAIYGGLALLYWGKSYENANTKAAPDVNEGRGQRTVREDVSEARGPIGGRMGGGGDREVPRDWFHDKPHH